MNISLSSAYGLQVRNIPGIGASTPEELKAASQKSNEAIAQVPGVEWVNSYVVQDQTFCIYKAPSEVCLICHHDSPCGLATPCPVSLAAITVYCTALQHVFLTGVKNS